MSLSTLIVSMTTQKPAPSCNSSSSSMTANTTLLTEEEKDNDPILRSLGGVDILSLMIEADEFSYFESKNKILLSIGRKPIQFKCRVPTRKDKTSVMRFITFTVAETKNIGKTTVYPNTTYIMVSLCGERYNVRKSRVCRIFTSELRSAFVNMTGASLSF